MARCCSESNRKISKCGNTFPLHCQILKVQKCNFFSVGNRTYILSYSHFRKLHVCTLFFLYLVFGSKIREIDHSAIPSEVVCLRPYPPQFLKNGHVPPNPSTQWFSKVRQSFFAASAHIQTLRTATSCFTRNLHFDLCFGGQGGMPGLSRALEPAQGSKVASGRLLLLPETKNGLFFGP